MTAVADEETAAPEEEEQEEQQEEKPQPRRRTRTSKKPAASTEARGYLKMLVFGPQGAGKTYLLGTAALDERTTPFLILDFEGGLLTLEGLPGKGSAWDLMHIRSWEDYNEAFERLRANEEGFRGVGIDSISETHLFALLQILEDEGGRRKDPDLLQQGDYGKASVQLRRLVRHFRDLPMHVIFTALAKDVTDPQAGTIKKPALSGQMADEIPGLFDVVGYLAQMEDEEGNPMRSLLLNNYPRVRTKARAPWGSTLPDEIDEPTVTSILDTFGY